MAKNKLPHDSLVKLIFSKEKYALDLFRLILSPAEFKAFNWKTLKTEMNTFIDKEGREKRTDILFSVALKNKKQSVKILLLLEHKSYEDPNLLTQMLEYQTAIYSNLKMPIIPILLYHGEEKKWKGELNFQDSIKDLTPFLRENFGKNMINFEPRLLNLRKAGLEKKYKDLTSSPIFFVLGNIWDLTLKEIKKFFALGKDLNEEDRKTIIQPAVDYIRQFNKEFTWNILQDIESKVLPEEKRIMGLLKETEERIELRGIEKGIEKGIKKGREEGRQEGREEGRQEGRQEGVEKVALQMLKKGADIHMICEYTDLTSEQVEALKNNGLSKK